MKYNLRLGNICFCLESQIDLRIEESLTPFLILENEKPDILVKINTDFQNAPLNLEPMLGEDLLLKYYPWKQGFLCVAKGGWKGDLSVTTCDIPSRNITCYLNTEIFSEQAHSIKNIMRLLPMRMLLQRHGVLFFHAAQIAVDGVGILFSAPSGTGKTTQAKLWNFYRNAEIICNDRTLVSKGKTYGYPVDGSEPVISGKVHSLGAIVLLEQYKRNQIVRLRPGYALSRLMEQLVFDEWNLHEKELAIELLLELLEKFPVYLLCCTPDSEAVFCLEEQLKKDGVLK